MRKRIGGNAILTHGALASRLRTMGFKQFILLVLRKGEVTIVKAVLARELLWENVTLDTSPGGIRD